MPDSLNLRLSLDNSSHFGVFLKAITDPQFRTNLPKGQLPPQASQILTMIEDPVFVTTCASAARQYSLFVRGTATRQTVTEAAQQVANLVNSKYPSAGKRLKNTPNRLSLLVIQ
jgi:hypothetical protein